MVRQLHGSGISIIDLKVFKHILLGSIYSISSHPRRSSIQFQFPLQHFIWALAPLPVLASSLLSNNLIHASGCRDAFSFVLGWHPTKS
jgi:hypothetical protein